MSSFLEMAGIVQLAAIACIMHTSRLFLEKELPKEWSDRARGRGSIIGTILVVAIYVWSLDYIRFHAPRETTIEEEER